MGQGCIRAIGCVLGYLGHHFKDRCVAQMVCHAIRQRSDSEAWGLSGLGLGRHAAWCGVVWRGVVWCGVVWCGVVWCGVVWCGVATEQYTTPPHSTTRLNNAPHYNTTTQYTTLQHNTTTRYATTQHRQGHTFYISLPEENADTHGSDERI